MDEFFERVKACAAKALREKEIVCGRESRLREDLEMTSMTLVLFQTELETEFDFQFDPIEDNFEKIFETMGSVCTAVQEKLSEG